MKGSLIQKLINALVKNDWKEEELNKDLTVEVSDTMMLINLLTLVTKYLPL